MSESLEEHERIVNEERKKYYKIINKITNQNKAVEEKE